MRNAFRRPSTWLLILALILLAIGVLYLLPRLLEPPPPPETNIAALEPAPGSQDGLEGSVQGKKPTEDETSAASAEEEGGARTAPSQVQDLADALSAPGLISGRVVDAAGDGVAGSLVLALHVPDLGTPIEAASWWITHLPLDVADPIALGAEVPARATTNEAGFFAFEDFEPGRVRLAVRSEKHDPIDRNDLWLASGGVLELPRIRVERGTTLSGRILDPDGLQVAGVPIVRVDDFAQAGLPPLSAAAGVVIGMTSARGGFESVPVGPGPWSYVVPGGTSFPDVRIEGASARDDRGIETVLGEDEEIRGRVRSGSRFSQPMVVRALPATPGPIRPASLPFACRSDARWTEVRGNGDYELTGLAPGVVYELRASEAGRPWEVDSAWSPPVLAVPGEERVELLWDPDASVTFRIVAPGTHAPPEECLAKLAGFDPETALVPAPSEATYGLSTIEGLRPRRLSSIRGLELSMPGFLPSGHDLDDLRPGRTLALGDVELSAVPTILVRVVDEATDRPIENAEVSAVETPIDFADQAFEFETRTDSKGVARVRSFGGAGSGIEIRAPGYAPARRQGPFGSGFSEPSLEIGLLRGATVRVRIVDSAGDPLHAARIEHVDGSWSPNETWEATKPFEIGRRPDPRASRVADENGAAEFRHLAPGRHAFRLQRYRRYEDSEWTLRELAEGDAAEIVLVSPATSTLEVRVHDGGLALTGAPAALVRPGDAGDPVLLLDPRTPLPPCVSARLDERGAASFSNLPPGRFLLLVQVPGQSVRASWDVNLAEGGSRTEIDLARRSIVGTVSHVDSGTLAGAEIRIAVWDSSDGGRSRSGHPFFGSSDGDDAFASGLEIPATITDESGAYRILGLPEGVRFFVTARAETYWRKGSGPVQLKAAGAETRADLSVQLAGAIEVRIGAGSRIVPCVLGAVSMDHRSRPRRIHTLSGGIEVLEALPPGTWEVAVHTGGREIRPVDVDVVAGETAVVQFALP